MPARLRARDLLCIFALTIAAVCVHGYHPFVEDAAIYVPGIKKLLNPQLYPHNDAFFMKHAHMTLFPNLVAGFTRLTHLSFEWSLLVLHVASIFFLLLGCFRLATFMFGDDSAEGRRARWAGVALVAGLLTIPVAGTSLYIFDEYLNPRSISVPALLFVVVWAYERRWIRAAVLAIAAAAIHPLMSAFAVAYVAISLVLERLSRADVAPRRESAATALLLLPFGLGQPVSEGYREILHGNSYFNVLRWEWFEWLGAIAPILLMWWFSKMSLSSTAAPAGLSSRAQRGIPTASTNLSRVCRDMAAFGAVFTVIALVISIPPMLAPLQLAQPMRAFHLVYIAFFLVAAGLISERVIRQRVWLWAALFVPLVAGMAVKQHEIFSATPQLELPGRASHNDWIEAFRWIRQNTPQDAYFALPPLYMELHDEDHQGFRAIAERSQLADRVKDRSAMSMFPEMGNLWKQQADATRNWNQFKAADFEKLARDTGVDWVLVYRGYDEESDPSAISVEGLNCPYNSGAIIVCRVNGNQ